MSFEWNKIFAALLVAGIVAKLSGFIANELVKPKTLEENAFKVEVAETDSIGVAGAAEAKAEPILALLAGADLEKGQRLSRACAACHSFEKGGEQRIGPNLWNIVNAKKGHIDGFAYSSALLAKGGNWSYESLNEFFWKPKTYIPGTKMNYIGLRRDTDRADIIAWLRTLSDNPAALPSNAQIQAELAKYSAE